MKNFLLIFALLLGTGSLSAQLTVETCWELARENYPLIARRALIAQAEQYTLSNAAKGYLPQLQLSAKASYQSDVTTVNIDVPGVDIPVLPKDNYDVKIELTQSIWDGGRIASRKEAARTSAQVDQQSLEVDLYALRERVNQLFFGILLLDEQLEQNRLLEQDLARTFGQISAYIAAGVANQADLDAVQVEQINAAQNRLSMNSLRGAYVQMLGLLIGREGDLRLVAPAGATVDARRVERPELELFAAQDADFAARLRSIKAGNMPALSLFAQGGYGKPGLDMFKTTFEPYGIAGVRLSWNFGGQYTKRNDRRLVENAWRSVEAQRETFLFNTSLTLTSQQRQVENIRSLMVEDDRLVELRGNIRRSAEAKVGAGTLSVTELMREVIAENLSRQNRAIHQVQLMQAIYEMKTTVNN